MINSRTQVEGWPALMSTGMAVRYVSIDEDSLLRIARKFDVPLVEIEDLPIRWRKRDLDRLVKNLPSASSKVLSDRPAPLFRLEPSQVEAIADAVARRIDRYGARSEGKLVSIKEATAILGIGRSSVYKMITDGSIETRKIGRRTLILRSDLEAILDGQEEG